MDIEITKAKIGTDNVFIIHQLGDLCNPILIIEEEDFAMFKDLVNSFDLSKDGCDYKLAKIKNAYNTQGKIAAIKLCRELFGYSLLDAKNYVESKC